MQFQSQFSAGFILEINGLILNLFGNAKVLEYPRQISQRKTELEDLHHLISRLAIKLVYSHQAIWYYMERHIIQCKRTNRAQKIGPHVDGDLIFNEEPKQSYK